MAYPRLRGVAAGLAGMIVVSIIGAHIYLLDGIDGAVLARTLGDTTVYAPDYTSAGFRQIETGTSERDVSRLIGRPLGETWVYEKDGCRSFYIRSGTVASHVSNACRDKGIRPGMSSMEVRQVFGSPTERVLLYSESQSDSHYRMRVLHLRDEQVSEVVTGFYID